MLLILTFLTGMVYPVVVTLAAQVLFPLQANGSLIVRDNVVIGSSLIGQVVDDVRYFSGRPSAVNAMQADTPTLIASGASNLSMTNPLLLESYAERSSAFRTANVLPEPIIVPSEMIMASGSGLDPDISVMAARLQTERIAEARGIPLERIFTLIDRYTQQPQYGFLGEIRVNVLQLNLALDAMTD